MTCRDAWQSGAELAENFEKDSFQSVRIRYNKVQAGELGGQHANESRAGLRGRGRTLDTARTEYCLRLVVGRRLPTGAAAPAAAESTAAERSAAEPTAGAAATGAAAAV